VEEDTYRYVCILLHRYEDTYRLLHIYGRCIDVEEDTYLLAASAPRHRGLVRLCGGESQLL